MPSKTATCAKLTGLFFASIFYIRRRCGHFLESMLPSQLLESTCRLQNVDISDLEDKIDYFVFNAYGLHPNDVEIIKRTLLDWEEASGHQI